MRRSDAVRVGWADRGMPLNPLEMSGGGVPGIGEPSCLTFGVPALASALACVSCLQVWPGGGCSAPALCCATAEMAVDKSAKLTKIVPRGIKVCPPTGYIPATPILATVGISVNSFICNFAASVDNRTDGLI